MRILTLPDASIEALLGSAWERLQQLIAAAQPAARTFYQQRLGRAMDINEAVEHIIDCIAREGDSAIQHFNHLFDGVEAEIPRLYHGPEDCAAALDRLDSGLAQALQDAATRIRSYQEALLPRGFGEALDLPLGLRWTPLERIAAYVPGGAGGNLPLCSSVLMNLIPAQVAGVPEKVLFTPSRADGSIHDAILAAAHLAGVCEVYGIGGVQAIAAAAHGSSSIRAVDKIVGPGNLFVTLAKRAVYGRVDIDMLAGPSEILVISDGSVPAAWVAADLLSQAEHDPVAVPALLCFEQGHAESVLEELEQQLADLPQERRQSAELSIRNMGWSAICRDAHEAIAIANRMAPEHLELLVQSPQDWLPQLHHAGAIFVGPWSPEPIGDYIAGPSHTLPTGGSARMWSGIGTDTFLRRTSIINFSQQDFQACAEQAQAIARSEGLEAHRRSIAIRQREQ